MKQRHKYFIPIYNVMIITIILFLLIFTTQTSALGAQPMVAAGQHHTVGLKSDGTVLAVGGNSAGQCNVSSWSDIVHISAHWAHTVGVKSDGTVVAVGNNGYGQCDVSSWPDIIQISQVLTRSFFKDSLNISAIPKAVSDVVISK